MTLARTNFKDYYSQEQLIMIKEELELEFGARLELEIIPTGARIRCERTRCRFEIYYHRNGNGFGMLNSFMTHLNDCDSEMEEIAFSRNRDRIIELRRDIYSIISAREDIYGCPGPARILWFLQATGRGFDIYDGVQALDLRRKLKKKLDNIVAEEKRRLEARLGRRLKAEIEGLLPPTETADMELEQVHHALEHPSSPRGSTPPSSPIGSEAEEVEVKVEAELSEVQEAEHESSREAAKKSE